MKTTVFPCGSIRQWRKNGVENLTDLQGKKGTTTQAKMNDNRHDQRRSCLSFCVIRKLEATYFALLSSIISIAKSFAPERSFLRKARPLSGAFSDVNILLLRLNTPFTLSLSAGTSKILMSKWITSSTVNHSPFPSLVTIFADVQSAL